MPQLNGTSVGPCGTTADAAPGGSSDPTRGGPLDGSATAGQPATQLNPPAAPAEPASPTSARRSHRNRVDVALTALGPRRDIGGTSVTVPPTASPTGPALPPAANSVGTDPTEGQTPASQRFPKPDGASPPYATSPAAASPTPTQPVVMAPTTSRTPAQPPVAGAPAATSPVTIPTVAAAPASTPSLSDHAPPKSTGNVMPRLPKLQTLWTGPAGKHRIVSRRTPAASSLPRPPRYPRRAMPAGMPTTATAARHSFTFAADDSFTSAAFNTGEATEDAGPGRPKRSSLRLSVAPPRAASSESATPRVSSPAWPVQTRLPIGEAATAGSGGIGSVAPVVAAALEALALALATIVLARLAQDLASWRSKLLTSRLEHPG